MTDVVDATIETLERPMPLRHEVAAILVENVQEFVRDDVCVATLRIEGLDREAFDEIDAHTVTGWKKRLELRSVTGALVGAVEWETDEGFLR